MGFAVIGIPPVHDEVYLPVILFCSHRASLFTSAGSPKYKNCLSSSGKQYMVLVSGMVGPRRLEKSWRDLIRRLGHRLLSRGWPSRFRAGSHWTPGCSRRRSRILRRASSSAKSVRGTVPPTDGRERSVLRNQP